MDGGLGAFSDEAEIDVARAEVSEEEIGYILLVLEDPADESLGARLPIGRVINQDVPAVAVAMDRAGSQVRLAQDPPFAHGESEDEAEQRENFTIIIHASSQPFQRQTVTTAASSKSPSRRGLEKRSIMGRRLLSQFAEVDGWRHIGREHRVRRGDLSRLTST